MTQLTFGDAEYGNKRKQTRREVFLDEMAHVVPWQALLDLIGPVYHKSGKEGGRPAYPLPALLRIHLMQNWFGLSDPSMEEALYENSAIRGFAQLSILDGLPDESTILRFRHLLETQDLAPKLFAAVNRHLQDKGLLLRNGTAVDATIIHAPSSTKNQDKSRDPDMHQTRKGNQYYFGMKAHIGVDVDSGLVHSVSTTAANVADIVETANLLHGKEKRVWADAGYVGVEKREEHQAREVIWKVARRRGKVKAIQDEGWREIVKKLETAKAKVRSRVEHPFRVIKRQFGYGKVRFKGLAKNTAQIFTLFALSNLWMARHRLMEATG